jgi:ADP-ribose pyrophosphatase YjhB (NUDIX family)
VEIQERFGRLRPVCPRCGWIYFADPKVAAAVLVERDGRLLLVRRTMKPHIGFWTLPAGFVDAGEDPARAAEREAQEETGFQVRVIRLLDVLSGREHPSGADIVLVYLAEIIGGQLQPGDDADQAEFFHPSSFPPLAFAATRKAIERWQAG